MNIKKVIDLSHTLIPDKEEYKLTLKTFFTDELYPQYKRKKDEWYILSELCFLSHVGTHVEVPYHHVKEGLDTADFPLERLYGEAILLDFTHKQTNEAITLQELKSLDDKIKHGDIVLIKTGLDVTYRTEKSHDRPYIATDAVEWLASKQIKCLGIDCSGIEPRGVEGQPNHLTLLQQGIPLIEYLANLNELTQERVFVFILPLKIKGLESCPVRVIAIED